MPYPKVLPQGSGCLDRVATIGWRPYPVVCRLGSVVFGREEGLAHIAFAHCKIMRAALNICLSGSLALLPLVWLPACGRELGRTPTKSRLSMVYP